MGCALACLTIVAYHVRPLAVPYGWASVDLFFVLSGYLITAILIRHEGSPRLLRNFYVRRGLRIWPVYYMTILAVVVAGPWLRGPRLGRARLPSDLYPKSPPLLVGPRAAV